MYRKLGYIKDPHDPRDYKFSEWTGSNKLSASASSTDLKSFYVPIDQGGTSSCVANAVAQAISCARSWKLGKQVAFPSRLGVYWFSRASNLVPVEKYIDETKISDDGTWIRSATTVVKNLGVVDESRWKFVESKVNDKPPSALWFKRTPKDSVVFRRIDEGKASTEQIVAALAARQPVAFGTLVTYDYMRVTGVKYLDKMSGTVAGGHAQCLLDSTVMNGKTYFLCANSWGSGWGSNGLVWLSQDILASSDTSDIWAIEAVK